MECSEFDMLIQEASSISAELNGELDRYLELQNQINMYQMRRLRPFSLENGDMDAGLEGLIQGTHNVISRIKNFIIKLWYTLKNILDKMLHLFSGTLKKLKGYQEQFKSGIDQSKFDAFSNTKLKVYKKVDMQKRLDILTREVEMKWVNSDGSVNRDERNGDVGFWANLFHGRQEGLIAIGHNLKVDGEGHVKQTYTGTLPKEDTLGSHGYTFADVSTFVNAIVNIYEKFPGYKENLKKMGDNEIDAKYKSATTSEQKYKAIIADRTKYILIQKLVTIVLKEMREIGKELVAICGAIQ